VPKPGDGLGWVGLGLGWARLGWTGSGWVRLGWVGLALGWVGLDWVGWVGLDWIGFGPSGRGKHRQGGTDPRTKAPWGGEHHRDQGGHPAGGNQRAQGTAYRVHGHDASTRVANMFFISISSPKTFFIFRI
jgi:hypothetical protein